MKLWVAKQSWQKADAAKKAASLEYSSVRNIAVIKHAALGDMMLTRPVLIQLREAFPNAHITLSIVSNYMRGIPDDLVDRVHVAKGNEKKYSLTDTWQSFKALGRQDILFDISATSRSFWLSLITPATLKIGYVHHVWHRLLYDIAIPRAHYRFEAETFTEQLNVIGIPVQSPPRFDMKVPSYAHQRPFILYFPTASTKEKSWPAKHYAALLRQACDRFPQYDHLLMSGIAAWEIETGEQIARSLGMFANFRFLRAPKEIMPIVNSAEMLVSADTGIRNVAIACDTVTVGIFPQSPTVFAYSPTFGRHAVVYDIYQPSPDVDAVMAAMCHSLGQALIPAKNPATKQDDTKVRVGD